MSTGGRLGVVLLEAEHAVETVALADPSRWTPPPGLGRGFFGHPGYWPCETVFAVAAGATGTTSALGTPEAVDGVVGAVSRLDGRCDLIVGGCGYFGDAWPHLATPRETPVLLSALDFLDDWLRATDLDVVIMSASTAAGQRAVGQHPQTERIRVIGVDGRDDWSQFAREDWATKGLVSEAGLERGLIQILEAETGQHGKLDGAGAVLLECTVLPQFRHVIRRFTSAPIIDVSQAALSALA